MSQQDTVEKRAVEWRAETLALHGGYTAYNHGHAAAVPIYQTSSFVFDDAQHGADLFDLTVEGHLYSRCSNPTVEVLERRIAALEGGVGALAVASGMAAIDYAISTLAEAGDHIVATTELYGGTHNVFVNLLAERGVAVTLVNKDDFEGIAGAIGARTKAIFVESIGNPSGGVVDLSRVAAIAHVAGVALIVDNTVASPALIRPIDFGADIVVHSATKSIGGHGNTVGGVIVDSGRFDWAAHASRYRRLSSPEPSYHGIVFTERFGDRAFIARARAVQLRNTGAVLAAHSAFLLLQGLETLALRSAQVSLNTRAIVDFLDDHPLVSHVRHVSLADHPDHSLVTRYIRNGTPGIVSFDLIGGKEVARAFFDALNLFLRLVNIGDSKSLAAIPAETTHHQLDAAALARIGISPATVRLSIGIENANDLIDDLDNALRIAGQTRHNLKAA